MNFDKIDFKNLHLVGDAETNGLLEIFDKIHVLAFCDYRAVLDGDEERIWVFTDQYIFGHKYSKYISGTLREGVEFALKAKEICIHNLMQYDWYVMNHIAPDLWNMKTCPPSSPQLQDSLVQSRVQWFDRPCPRGYKGSHGLAAWGKRVGVPKPEIEDWSTWNGDMLTRVVDDIKINAKTKLALETEKKKLLMCGVDTEPTYLRTKQTSFWMAQQALNGWKADADLMRKNVEQLDQELKVLSDEIEPRLPKTIKTKGSITYKEFKESWDTWIEESGLDDVRVIRKYPKTQYRQRMKDGVLVDSPIKPLAKFSTKLWNIEKVKTYSLRNETTGETHPKTFIKMADARALAAELGKKDWKPFKTESEKKIYNVHVANHFGFSTREYDEVIAAPFTPITFEDSRMSQSAVVKKYLSSVGWIPDEWNYKTDSDNRPVKVCKMSDNGKLIRKHSKFLEMVLQNNLSYIEHEGVFYIEYTWNLKRDPIGKMMEPSLLRTSAKLTESSFDTIQGELGQKIARYNTLLHRRRTLENPKHDEKGWLNLIREDGRLSAGATVHGTSTGRMTQWGIVNVPSGSAVYGAPMREVWVCEEGTKIVSVDMNSAQLVILCNYMGDEKFTEAVKNGHEKLEYKPTEDGRYYCKEIDNYLNPETEKYLKHYPDQDIYEVYAGTDAHTLNSVYFALNVDSDIVECRLSQNEELLHKITSGRKLAKNGIYALLFGSGDEKFARTIKMRDKTEGAKTKQTYFTRLPKIKILLDELERQYEETKSNLVDTFGMKHAISKGGYIHVAGAWLWVKSKHKLLNYLLMGTEAQIQNEAVNLACSKMVEEGLMKIDGRKPAEGARLLLAYHDEQSFEAPNIMVDRVKEIMDWMYGQASKNLGLRPETLVTGTAQIGESWLEVH